MNRAERRKIQKQQNKVNKFLKKNGLKPVKNPDGSIGIDTEGQNILSIDPEIVKKNAK